MVFLYMKKRDLFLFIFLFYSLEILFATAETITGEAITGQATSQLTNVSITLTGAPPALSLLSPRNGTYFYNRSILLNYSASGEQTVWYNLDNSSNITLTSIIYFNVTEGNHILRIYANNTNAEVTSIIAAFSLNLTKFNILYSKYNGTNKGNSFDFYTYTLEEIQNLDNIILENILYGKILFTEALNLTNISSNTLDLDSFTNISYNQIEIDSLNLPNFNHSARLYLYNLTFADPIILIDGNTCPTSICTEVSYSNGLLIFDVTHFSIYSAAETPVASSASSSSSTSGGGGGITALKPEAIGDFEITPAELNIFIKPGEQITKEITIKNKGDKTLDITADITGISDILSLNESQFKLAKGKEKKIILTIKAPDFGVSAGRIIFSVGGIKKEVFILINVEGGKKLFDVSLTIPDSQKIISQGKNINVFSSLTQMGAPFEVDVKITYVIKDFNGNTLNKESETVFVYKAKSFVKELSTANLPPGDYVIGMEITYQGGFAASSTHFNIVKKTLNFQLALIIFFVFLAIAVIIYSILKYKKSKAQPNIER